MSSNEATDPHLEKPISIPPGCVSIEEYRELKATVELLVSENRAVVRLFLPDANGQCPIPVVQCEALKIAKDVKKRLGHPKLWTALGSAIILSIGAIVGAAVQAITGGVARAQAKATIETEMPKYQQSTAAIAEHGGKVGGREALDEFERTHRGLVITSQANQ